MIYVYYQAEKKQVLFSHNPADEGTQIGSMSTMPESSLSFVAHALLIKAQIPVQQGMSVVVGPTPA